MLRTCGLLMCCSEMKTRACAGLPWCSAFPFTSPFPAVSELPPPVKSCLVFAG
ncbi:hypothetical protein U0070_013309 [Myodes glareolus]|uniref:Uncharacterized protein n=1 Tax=Myodes glareolus TaxID=447135 RepID=A0AAW0JRK7_MYOGA